MTAGSRRVMAEGESKTGRWVLAGAAALALAAVGYAISQQGKEAAPVETAPAEQPPVAEVIARLEAQLAKDPDDAEGWQMLGWSYFQTGRYAEAATAFRRATSLDPDNAEYFSMLGEALVLASENGDGLPADAEAAFERALALDPADPRARYFHAVALDLDGRHEAAIAAWFDLLEDTPSDAPWAADVRRVIADVAAAHDIDVAERLAKTGFAPASGGLATDGAQVATGAIPGPSQQQMRAAQGLPPGQQEAMIRGMVDKLPTAGSC